MAVSILFLKQEVVCSALHQLSVQVSSTFLCPAPRFYPTLVKPTHCAPSRSGLGCSELLGVQDFHTVCGAR